MSERSYPYEAWMVVSIGEVKNVTAVRCSSTTWAPNWDVLENGGAVIASKLHASKEGAILQALQEMDDAKAKLENMLSNLSAKRKTLEAQL